MTSLTPVLTPERLFWFCMACLVHLYGNQSDGIYAGRN